MGDEDERIKRIISASMVTIWALTAPGIQEVLGCRRRKALVGQRRVGQGEEGGRVAVGGGNGQWGGGRRGSGGSWRRGEMGRGVGRGWGEVGWHGVGWQVEEEWGGVGWQDEEEW